MIVRKKNRTDPVTGKLVLSIQINQHGRWVNLARPGGKVVFATEAERDAHLKTMKNIQFEGEETSAEAAADGAQAEPEKPGKKAK